MSNKFGFTDAELAEIKEMKEEFERLSDREKLMAKEALKEYFYGKKS